MINNYNDTLLITGGLGFIGSNFISYFLDKYKNYNIINLDKITYAGDRGNSDDFRDYPNYRFIKGDICNRELVEYIFHEFDIKGVIHFAAESHVDNSIDKPENFILTNIYGTYVLLDVAKNYWMNSSDNGNEKYKYSRFHHISTDEVFGTLGRTGYFTESSPYSPNSPYSASKASSDMLVRSYFYTYGLNVVTTNCSNNYGPKQHKEKFIPTIIRKALNFDKIPIYGDGKNVRDWLHVNDHCRAIDLVFHNGISGEVYNIGGSNELENIYVAKKVCSILDEMVPSRKRNSAICSYKELITFVKDRPGHDFRYSINSSKIFEQLKWEPIIEFDTGITKTIEWYVNNSEQR